MEVYSRLTQTKITFSCQLFVPTANKKFNKNASVSLAIKMQIHEWGD